MTRRKKKLSEFKKLPPPITIDEIVDDPNPNCVFRLKIQLRPDADEIIDEAKRRGYDSYENGEFKKSDE